MEIPVETEILAEQENFAGLARINRELVGKAEAVDSPHPTVADHNKAPSIIAMTHYQWSNSLQMICGRNLRENRLA